MEGTLTIICSHQYTTGENGGLRNTRQQILVLHFFLSMWWIVLPRGQLGTGMSSAPAGWDWGVWGSKNWNIKKCCRSGCRAVDRGVTMLAYKKSQKVLQSDRKHFSGAASILATVVPSCCLALKSTATVGKRGRRIQRSLRKATYHCICACLAMSISCH